MEQSDVNDNIHVHSYTVHNFVAMSFVLSCTHAQFDSKLYFVISAV